MAHLIAAPVFCRVQGAIRLVDQIREQGQAGIFLWLRGVGHDADACPGGYFQSDDRLNGKT